MLLLQTCQILLGSSYKSQSIRANQRCSYCCLACISMALQLSGIGTPGGLSSGNLFSVDIISSCCSFRCCGISAYTTHQIHCHILHASILINTQMNGYLRIDAAEAETAPSVNISVAGCLAIPPATRIATVHSVRFSCRSAAS